MNTLGSGVVVGVFNSTIPEMSASETFFKPEFQGNETVVFIK